MVVKNFNEKAKEAVDVLERLKELNKTGMLKIKGIIIESDDDEVEAYILDLDRMLEEYRSYI